MQKKRRYVGWNSDLAGSEVIASTDVAEECEDGGHHWYTGANGYGQ